MRAARGYFVGTVNNIIETMLIKRKDNRIIHGLYIDCMKRSSVSDKLMKDFMSRYTKECKVRVTHETCME